MDSVKEAAMDRTWLALGGSALLSGVCSGVEFGWPGLVEGVSIIVAACVIIAITSAADWLKDRRFIELQGLIKDERVPVIRGKFGASLSISVWELVVGDVILLETGSRVPADCLVVESSDLAVDETIDANDTEVQSVQK